MVAQHTIMAVDKVPDPIVDLVRISAALTSYSEVSFLISLTLPSLSDPVSALINLGATSNFLDSSLATSPPFVLEPLDHLVALCLFDGKPATAGFICHDPFPELSHIVIPTLSPLGLLHH